jgi:hypothetical protein
VLKNELSSRPEESGAFPPTQGDENRLKAILRLQQAVEHGFLDADQMAADDDLKPLRGDSLFQALLAQVHKAHVSAQ